MTTRAIAIKASGEGYGHEHGNHDGHKWNRPKRNRCHALDRPRTITNLTHVIELIHLGNGVGLDHVTVTDLSCINPVDDHPPRRGVVILFRVLVLIFGCLSGHFHQALLLYFMRLSKMRFRALWPIYAFIKNAISSPFAPFTPFIKISISRTQHKEVTTLKPQSAESLKIGWDFLGKISVELCYRASVEQGRCRLGFGWFWWGVRVCKTACKSEQESG